MQYNLWRDGKLKGCGDLNINEVVGPESQLIFQVPDKFQVFRKASCLYICLYLCM